MDLDVSLEHPVLVLDILDGCQVLLVGEARLVIDDWFVLNLILLLGRFSLLGALFTDDLENLQQFLLRKLEAKLQTGINEVILERHYMPCHLKLVFLWFFLV